MDETSDSIEQYLHITEMKAELDGLSDGTVMMGKSEDMPQDLEEGFLAHILAYERAEQVPLRTLLERDGLVIPEPTQLSDAELSVKLDELIQAMARQRNFLYSTDHLSDRELYAHLVEITLEETVPDMPPDDRGHYHVDINSGCSDEDVHIYLKYYADEATRAHWAESFSDIIIPPREDPPYDRDRHLPKPPPPPDPYEDPEVAAKWCARQHERLLQQLADEGIVHGDIRSEPVSYAPPMAGLWAVPGRDPGTSVEWWALNGDCPFAFISAEEVPNPRDFLRLISQRWHSEVDALELAHQQAEEAAATDESPCVPIRPFYMRRHYAHTFERWAADDSAWNEEWKLPSNDGMETS